MINSQSQKSGDDSTNIQANQLILNVGIDEKRAREIYQEMNLQIRSEYSKEAFIIANARINEFEEKLLPKMERVDGALEAFADPSFQILLVEAQKTAAASERSEDYDLLSELLIHRFQRGENRIVRAGISLAVGIVDKISDDALIGLTVAHAVNSFRPISGDINLGLDVLDDLFGKIFYGRLPNGRDWIDHLDVLNTIRMNPLVKLVKLDQYYSNILTGYIDLGIEKNTENHEKSIQILKNNNLPRELLIDHAFNSNFSRIILNSKNDINTINLQHTIIHDGKANVTQTALTDVQVKAIESIFDLYTQNASLRQNNLNAFMLEWEKRPHLKTLREWWDNIPVAFTLTSIGRVLAHSNAQRCDNNLPSMN